MHLVVSRHAIKKPDVMCRVIFLRVVEVGILCRDVKSNRGFRIARSQKGFLNCHLTRLALAADPVVPVTSKRDDCLVRIQLGHSTRQGSLIPILGGNRAWITSHPMLVVSHED